jgi:hypothetical protein
MPVEEYANPLSNLPKGKTGCDEFGCLRIKRIRKLRKAVNAERAV